MTPEGRERMRSTIRRALDRRPSPAASLEHPGAFTAEGPATLPATNLVERFTAELTALGGSVHVAESIDDVVRTILSTRASHGEGEVLAWDERHLPVHGVLDRLRERGIAIIAPVADSGDPRDHRSRLAAASVGLTGADAGLADTGSVVVTSGPGRPRLASLLPPAHVVLLPRNLIVESLPRFLRTRPELVTAGSNLVCITGPSRTADIEHTLSRGVHGPKELHVVLLPDGGIPPAPE